MPTSSVLVLLVEFVEPVGVGSTLVDAEGVVDALVLDAVVEFCACARPTRARKASCLSIGDFETEGD